MIAVRDAFKGHLFTRKNCLANIVPGIVVGIVALPLAMAFAISAGVPPEKGLYTAIVAGFLWLFLAVVVCKLQDLQVLLLLF